MSMPWQIIIPGLVEIAKEIIGLFKSKRPNFLKRRRVRKFIRKKYPGISDNQANLLLEMMVSKHKEGMDQNAIVKYIEGYVVWDKVWPKSGTVLAKNLEKSD